KVFTLPTSEVLQYRLFELVKLIVWNTPGLLVLALIGYERLSRRIPFKLMAASAMLTFAGYFFVQCDQGHGWGARYFHSAWGVLPLLGAAAFLPRADDDEDSRRLAGIAGTAAILSLVF